MLSFYIFRQAKIIKRSLKEIKSVSALQECRVKLCTQNIMLKIFSCDIALEYRFYTNKIIF